jgi:hypothetical protein
MLKFSSNVTVLSLLLAASAPALGAPTAFVESFESYADQNDFQAAWRPNGAPPHVVDAAFGRNSSHSIRLVPQVEGTGTTNRWYKDFSSPFTPSDKTPVRFSFDFFLDPAGAESLWALNWQSIDLRAFRGGAFGQGALDGVVSMGVANTLVGFPQFNADVYNGQYFQARVLTPSRRTATYWSLDQAPAAAPRSSGWHTLAVKIGATQVQFFVDGLPAETVAGSFTTPITSIVLGSDLPSALPFWIDNIQVVNVAEPVSTWLLALAAPFVRRRRAD